MQTWCCETSVFRTVQSHCQPPWTASFRARLFLQALAADNQIGDLTRGECHLVCGKLSQGTLKLRGDQGCGIREREAGGELAEERIPGRHRPVASHPPGVDR